MPFFKTISEVVESSTYFQRGPWEMFKSFIKRMNNQGPSLVPCDTPAGTDSHEER